MSTILRARITSPDDKALVDARIYFTEAPEEIPDITALSNNDENDIKLDVILQPED